MCAYTADSISGRRVGSAFFGVRRGPAVDECNSRAGWSRAKCWGGGVLQWQSASKLPFYELNRIKFSVVGTIPPRPLHVQLLRFIGAPEPHLLLLHAATSDCQRSVFRFSNLLAVFRHFQRENNPFSVPLYFPLPTTHPR